MEWDVVRVTIPANDVIVVPGFLYDETTRNFFARTDGENIETEDCPFSFNIDIWDLRPISELRQSKNDIHQSKWERDLLRENPKAAILIKGVKVLEKRGVNVPRTTNMNTVSSVSHTSFLNMLVLLSHKVSNECMKDVENYMDGVLSKADVSFISNDLTEHITGSYIYISLMADGLKISSPTQAFEIFCQNLRDLETSTYPSHASLKPPLESALANFLDNAKQHVIAVPNILVFQQCIKSNNDHPHEQKSKGREDVNRKINNSHAENIFDNNYDEDTTKERNIQETGQRGLLSPSSSQQAVKSEISSLGISAEIADATEVHFTTPIESAEKDLQADLRTFFMSYQKSQKYALFSKENMLLCEQIWEQAAVVHRLRSAQKLTTGSTERILIEFSKSVCQESHLPPSNCIPILTLTPSKGLTVAGTSIISTMKPLYTFAQTNYPNAKVSKNIAERSYCLNCTEEHKMKRCEEKGFVSKYIPGFGHNILALRCENCHCPGEVHAVSEEEAPLHSKRVLSFTLERLQTALTNYSFPGYTIEPEFFLNFLKNYLSSPYENFMGDCLKMLQEVKSKPSKK